MIITYCQPYASPTPPPQFLKELSGLVFQSRHDVGQELMRSVSSGRGDPPHACPSILESTSLRFLASTTFVVPPCYLC